MHHRSHTHYFVIASLLMPVFFVTNQALAFFDVEANIGRTSNNWTGVSGSNTLTGSAYSAAAHLDPIPLVPVSFGLRLRSQSLTEKSPLKLESSPAFAPEVTAWLPLGDFQPFVRLGYYVGSSYKESTTVSSGSNTTDAEVTWTGNGPSIGAGIKYSILPLIQILATYEQTSEAMTYKSGSIKGSNPSAIDLKTLAKGFTLKSQTFLVGISVGI